MTATTASTRRLLVVGAGLMGAQIAVEYALGGWDVSCLVRDEHRTRERIAGALAVAQSAGLADLPTAHRLAAAIALAASPADLRGRPELIVESLPEDLECKVGVLGPLARSFPDAAIASNTSSLSITELGARLGAGPRTVGTHYWNPPLLMPPVELVLGEETAPALVAQLRGSLEELGKLVVVVAHDVPGFIWNRLQAALVREATHLVSSGVASARDVDVVVREGLARRLRYCGPFETIALGGVATWQSVMANLFPELSTTSVAPDLEQFVSLTGEPLRALRARRDVGLAGELRKAAGK